LLKKIFITALILYLMVVVTATLSKQTPSEQATYDRAEKHRKSLAPDRQLDDDLWQRMQEKAAERQPTERSKVGVSLSRLAQ
jgi:hypothetical protein